MHKWGYHRYPSKQFLCHSAETILKLTPLCFRKFQRSKRFMHKRGLSRLSVEKCFCLTVPKHFIEEPFSVSENMYCRKMLRIRQGHLYLDFPSEVFFLTGTKQLLEEILWFEKFGYRKNLCIIGEYHDFLPKSLVGERNCVWEKFVLFSEYIMHKSERGITILRRTFFVSHWRKISPANPLVFHYFRVK